MSKIREMKEKLVELENELNKHRKKNFVIDSILMATTVSEQDKISAIRLIIGGVDADLVKREFDKLMCVHRAFASMRQIHKIS